MELNVKSSGAGGKSFQLKAVERTITVLELKKKCSEECGIGPEQQRLFLKGKLLKDEDTLETCKINDKATLFLVKGAAVAGAEGAAAAAGSTAADASKKEESKEPEAPLVSVPCAGGCGFFGTAKTENYCSKCYSKKAVTEDAKEKKEVEEKKAEETKKTEVEAEAAKEGGDASGSSEAPRKEQEDKTKCWFCGKKCGLTGFECKCGYTFCAKHRYAEEHDCEFDHQKRGREILAKNNPNLAAKSILEPGP